MAAPVIESQTAAQSLLRVHDGKSRLFLSAPESFGADTLAVVIPFLNEERLLGSSLEALAGQDDRDFKLILVDNGSDDHSRSICEEFVRRHPEVDCSILTEETPGTGAAADTGFRYAIALGADIVARTDADTLPRHDWTKQIRLAFSRRDVLLLAGRSVARRDDVRLTVADRVAIVMLLIVGNIFAPLRPYNRGPSFRTGYMIIAGHNLAVRSEFYVACGGFPRTQMRDVFEESVLLNRARTRTDRIWRCADVVVATSARRLKAYGYLGTLRWYRHHRPSGRIDIR